MDLVDHLYNEHLNRMTGTERVGRACELLDGVIAMIEHQLRLEQPEISDRELRLRTAEILYLNDPEAQGLIRQAREHGPG